MGPGSRHSGSAQNGSRRPGRNGNGAASDGWGDDDWEDEEQDWSDWEPPEQEEPEKPRRAPFLPRRTRPIRLRDENGTPRDEFLRPIVDLQGIRNRISISEDLAEQRVLDEMEANQRESRRAVRFAGASHGSCQCIPHASPHGALHAASWIGHQCTRPVGGHAAGQHVRRNAIWCAYVAH